MNSRIPSVDFDWRAIEPDTPINGEHEAALELFRGLCDWVYQGGLKPNQTRSAYARAVYTRIMIVAWVMKDEYRAMTSIEFCRMYSIQPPRFSIWMKSFRQHFGVLRNSMRWK